MKELNNVVIKLIELGDWVNNNEDFIIDYGGYEFELNTPTNDEGQLGDWYILVKPHSHGAVYDGYCNDSSHLSLADVLKNAIRESLILADLLKYQYENTPTFDHLEQLVSVWAMDKGIFDKGTPHGQAEKTIEEAVEIKDAIEAHDEGEIADGIGDTLVTLIIQARMQKMDILKCLHSAYLTIADRTGRMVNGVFIKDGQ